MCGKCDLYQNLNEFNNHKRILIERVHDLSSVVIILSCMFYVFTKQPLCTLEHIFYLILFILIYSSEQYWYICCYNYVNKLFNHINEYKF